LQILAGLDAAAAQDALIGIVSIERIAAVDLIRLRLEWIMLMLDPEKLGGVMNGAITVVVIANRAIEFVVPENAVKRFGSSCLRFRDDRGDLHPGCDRGRAGTDEFSIDLDDARIAGLNRP